MPDSVVVPVALAALAVIVWLLWRLSVRVLRLGRHMDQHLAEQAPEVRVISVVLGLVLLVATVLNPIVQKNFLGFAVLTGLATLAVSYLWRLRAAIVLVALGVVVSGLIVVLVLRSARWWSSILP